jgi:thiol-disulfide isomerase/thioredoxin
MATQKKEIKKQPKENKKVKIVLIATVIILLLVSLLVVLSLGNKVKSESEQIMEKFNNVLSSSSLQTIIYYNSAELEAKTGLFELEYLNQISKDYKIDYFEIDYSKLNEKNRNEIENTLGINGTDPTTVVVKDNKVVAVQEGFIESHKYVDFLIKANVLKEGSKYSKVSNLTFIDYNDYLDIIKNKYVNLVVVGQAGCEYCKAAKPILNNIAKGYKIKINYIDVTDLNNTQLKEFFDELPKLGYDNEELTENDSFSMPTLLIIDNGKIISYYEGSHSLEEYVSYLKENKVIKG